MSIATGQAPINQAASSLELEGSEFDGKTGEDSAIDVTGLRQLKLPPKLDMQWPKGHSTLWELISSEVGNYVEEVGTSVLTALGADVVTTGRYLSGTGERHFEVDVKWPNGGNHIVEEVKNHHSLAIEALEDKIEKSGSHLEAKLNRKIDQVEGKVDKLAHLIGELLKKCETFMVYFGQSPGKSPKLFR